MSLRSYPSVDTRLPAMPAESVAVRAASTAGKMGTVTLTASQLLGMGSTGDVAAITLGSNMTMSGTTLSASGGTIVSSALGLIVMVRLANYQV